MSFVCPLQTCRFWRVNQHGFQSSQAIFTTTVLSTEGRQFKGTKGQLGPRIYWQAPNPIIEGPLHFLSDLRRPKTMFASIKYKVAFLWWRVDSGDEDSFSLLAGKYLIQPQGSALSCSRYTYLYVGMTMSVSYCFASRPSSIGPKKHFHGRDVSNCHLSFIALNQLSDGLGGSGLWTCIHMWGLPLVSERSPVKCRVVNTLQRLVLLLKCLEHCGGKTHVCLGLCASETQALWTWTVLSGFKGFSSRLQFINTHLRCCL